MTRQTQPYVSMARYGMPDITMPAIRKYARQVAQRFKPDKIILFGSFAYGEPTEDSDVDLLVVMPCPNHVTQAVRIMTALDAPFPLDLIVRSPQRLRQRIKDEDWFLREITERGKVLYEKAHARVAAQGRGRLARRQNGSKAAATGA